MFILALKSSPYGTQMLLLPKSMEAVELYLCQPVESQTLWQMAFPRTWKKGKNQICYWSFSDVQPWLQAHVGHHQKCLWRYQICQFSIKPYFAKEHKFKASRSYWTLLADKKAFIDTKAFKALLCSLSQHSIVLSSQTLADNLLNGKMVADNGYIFW